MDRKTSGGGTLLRRRKMINNEKESSNQNLIVLNECTDGEKMPDGATAVKGKYLVTPFIEVDNRAEYYHNFSRNLYDGTIEWNQKLYMYDENKKYLKNTALNGNEPAGTMIKISILDNTKYVRILFRTLNNNPYFGDSENGARSTQTYIRLRR